MKTFSLLLFVFFLSINNQTIAQELPIPKTMQSPNASSLGKYGDVPVSYYNGAPNISVPLYSLNKYGIPLEVSLNYDASGVRVNSMPGWVGQNWSLQAGGIITRIEKGRFADEYNIDDNFNSIGFLYPESRNHVNVINWDNESYFPTLNSLLNGTDGNSRDFEPDVFTFNFMGFTGKFFLSSDGHWKVSSESNLKVIIDQNDFKYPFNKNWVPFNDNAGGGATITPVKASKLIYKITIIDDSGNSYIFGNTDHSIEYDVPFFDQVPYGMDPGGRWSANSWYLTEVKNRFGKKYMNLLTNEEIMLPLFLNPENLVFGMDILLIQAHWTESADQGSPLITKIDLADLLFLLFILNR